MNIKLKDPITLLVMLLTLAVIALAIQNNNKSNFERAADDISEGIEDAGDSD